MSNNKRLLGAVTVGTVFVFIGDVHNTRRWIVKGANKKVNGVWTRLCKEVATGHTDYFNCKSDIKVYEN